MSCNAPNRNPTFSWVNYISGANEDNAKSVALDSQHNVIITGICLDHYSNPGVTFTGTSGDYVYHSSSPFNMNEMYLAKYDSNGDVIWVAHAYGWLGVIGLSVAVDSQDNILVSGTLSQYVTFTGTNSTTIFASGSDFGDFFVTKYNSAGEVQWVAIGGTPDNQDDAGKVVKVDSQDNVYLTGTFSGSSIRLVDGQGTVTNLTPNNSTAEGYLIKYAPNGAMTWIRRFNGHGYTSSVLAMTIAKDGTNENIFVGGYFYGQLSFEPNGHLLTDANSRNAQFLVKYDLNGNDLLSLKGTGTGALSSAAIYGLSADNLGNIYSVGYVQDTVTLEGTAGGQTLSSSTDYRDVCVSKYDSSGNLLWAVLSGSPTHDDGIAIDSTDDGVVVVGKFNGTAVFHGTSGKTVSLSGTNDSFIVKYCPDGSVIWGEKISSDSTNNIFGVVIDCGTGVYLCGNYEGTLDTFGHQSIAQLIDGFLLKLLF